MKARQSEINTKHHSHNPMSYNLFSLLLDLPSNSRSLECASYSGMQQHLEISGFNTQIYRLHIQERKSQHPVRAFERPQYPYLMCVLGHKE
jgi:hypothetical protein